MTSETISQTLEATGICVCPGFLSPSLLAQTADDLDSLRKAGRFQQARTGRDFNHPDKTRVRNDDTYWLERDTGNATQAILWQKIDSLMLAFNRSLFLGLTEFEGHYAVYPEGGFYARHKDCFRGDSGRVVSFVLYLNRDWRAADGGRLRIYSTGVSGEETYRDIDPVGGTMVCFLSADSEHEVLLSHRPRYSLTGWFKRPAR